MNIRSIPIYGRMPIPLEDKKKAESSAIIVAPSEKKIELPLEIVYSIFEAELNLIPFLLKCFLISPSFYNAARSFLFCKPEAQREWIKKGFDQYDFFKIKNYYQTSHQCAMDGINIDAAAKSMNLALENVNHISFNMMFSNNHQNNYLNGCKIISAIKNENIITFHLSIYSDFKSINNNAVDIRNVVAESIAMAFNNNTLKEIKLLIQGILFSAGNFVQIFHALQAQKKAKVEISIINCIFFNAILERISPYLSENIIDFKLIQDRTSLANLISNPLMAPLNFSSFYGKFINAKKITIQSDSLNAESVKNISKIINSNTVELNLSGVKAHNDMLYEQGVLSGLGDQGVKDLYLSIKNIATNIKNINLSENNISSNGIDSLLDLMSITSIKEVDLSWNKFDYNGVCRIISSLLDEKLDHIEYINMSHLYFVGYDSIKEILEDMMGGKEILAEHFLSKNPIDKLLHVYKKISYQKDNGAVINIFISEIEHFARENIEKFEDIERNFVKGIQTTYISDGDSSSDGSESESESEDSIPEKT